MKEGFDLQAHRGGMALTVENTLAAFTKALGIGVCTLEFDVQITRDGYAVVAHDSDPRPDRCVDTAPVFAGDPEFPYVRDEAHVRDLTLAQVRTIDVGSRRNPLFPDQELAPGARIPMLSEVFDLVRSSGADHVCLNIETKVAAPRRAVPTEVFVDVVVEQVRRAGMVDRVTIQSFDWSSLVRVREVEPRLRRAALTDGAGRLEPDREGASPWLAGLDIDDYGGSLPRRYVAAAGAVAADVASPVHGEPPLGSPRDDDYTPFVTADLVAAAHGAGMRVVPWTVDEPAMMRSMIDLGVDGLITNRPDVLREVMAQYGLPLPTPVR